jgi:hypothetical protein
MCPDARNDHGCVIGHPARPHDVVLLGQEGKGRILTVVETVGASAINLEDVGGVKISISLCSSG